LRYLLEFFKNSYTLIFKEKITCVIQAIIFFICRFELFIQILCCLTYSVQ
jgi:hypothetical protein